MTRPSITRKGDGEAVVYILRPQVTGRFFNLMVGGERMSCQDVVKQIASDSHPAVTGVQVSSLLLQSYNEEVESVREQMAHCLLQSLAFYKLLNN